jgi:hypothetical protein
MGWEEEAMKENKFKVGLNEMARHSHRHALDLGQWSGSKSQQLSVLLLMVVKDLTKVMDEDRAGHLDQMAESIPSISRFEEKMADIMIRLMDMGGAYKLDLEMAVAMKMAVNDSKRRR